MGVIRRLDDLDTRVLGRGDPNWKSRTLPPWTQGMKPPIPARGSYVPEAWTWATIGVVALVLVFTSSSERLIRDALVSVVSFPLSALVSYRVRFSHPLVGAAVPVPADVRVERSREALWTMAVIAGLVLVAVLLTVDRDPVLYFFFSGVSLGAVLGMVGAERGLARWEDEHGVELLRASRWRLGGLYARPREGSLAPAGTVPS